jgi:predicted nucleotidyltransferase
MCETGASHTLVVKEAVTRAGLSWLGMLETAEEIVLFGSQAMGFAKQDSDVDVLIVGGEKRRTRTKIADLDLIYLNQNEIFSKGWLESELAFHIKRYGVWLKGCGQWRKRARPGALSKRKKRVRIAERAKSVIENLSYLTPHQIKFHLTKIRRDCQRAVFLESEIPGTCSSQLDHQWTAIPSKMGWFRNELEKSGLSDEEAKRLVELAEAVAL